MSTTQTTPRSSSYTPPAKKPAGQIDPVTDLVDYVKTYAREKPDVAALWCLGIGFVIGWKLKPW